MFAELAESIEEMDASLRGEHVEGLRITYVGEPDPREVRAKLGMPHEDFAAALCITVDERTRWEQGHRNPGFPAARLVWIAENHADVLPGLRRANECPLEVYTLSHAVRGRGCEL